ncbi:MAG: ORF6N domain-containing protein [Nanobdellota archaeon]
MDIKDKIYNIRGKQVMLDRDLAELYGVETRRINEQVKRNKERFPEKFMFQLTNNELKNIRDNNWVSQNATPNKNKMGLRIKPYVFTEQGVSMLSAVLKSKKAVEVSIKIMDAFVKMRHFLSQNSNVFSKFQQIDQKLIEHDQNFNKIFNEMEKNQIEYSQGIFFEGQVYDAHDFVVKLIKKANSEIILIDNYIDSSVITLFSEKKDNVNVKIYTQNISEKLELAVSKFNKLTYTR